MRDDVPADFAPYVTADDIRQMAEGILSVDHIGLGIDTICRIRSGEKSHEWTNAMVRLDEDEKIGISIEDDGFTALESMIAATTTGTLTLTASYEKVGEEPRVISISDPTANEAESDRAMKYFIRNLESIWDSATKS